MFICDLSVFSVGLSVLGLPPSLLFAGGGQNLEMITAQLYTWVCEWKSELVHVINKNIIKDQKNNSVGLSVLGLPPSLFSFDIV